MLGIIGSGFGRTGTQSLKRALERLGLGPCHHMEEMFANPAMLPAWEHVAKGGAPDWPAMFPGYRAQVDWPGAAMWREAAAAFPDARVIHTERPEEDWWQSFSATIGAVVPQRARHPNPHVRRVMDMAHDLILGRSLAGTGFGREPVLAAYRRNNEEVRAAIAPERLLVFFPAQGWEPLCRFLGVAVPDEPFPRGNSTAEFRAATGLDSAPG